MNCITRTSNTPTIGNDSHANGSSGDNGNSVPPYTSIDNDDVISTDHIFGGDALHVYRRNVDLIEQLFEGTFAHNIHHYHCYCC
jgi:hypothetical protein